MFKVNICNDKSSADATKYAASKCYNKDVESCIKNFPNIDIGNTLYKTGHHTTLQHAKNYVSFDIEDIPVSLITFGLHLTHPFYNSSQRSGRYCLDMFNENNRENLIEYIGTFIDNYKIIKSKAIIDWFLQGFDYFHENLDKVKYLVIEAMSKERPNYRLDIERQALRIAQEQLRVFISTIVPTGIVHSLNHISLFAMYQSAWNDPLKDLFKQMVDSIDKDEIREAFENHRSIQDNSFCFEFSDGPNSDLLSYPVVSVEPSDFINRYMIHKLEYLFMNHQTLDTLYFNPNSYPTIDDLENFDFKACVSVPVITFAQDQRHRMINRSIPIVTGNFFVSHLLRNVPGLCEFAREFNFKYNQLVKTIGQDMIYFIPYGSVVSYSKRYDLRAYAHCIKKRLCFNAESVICKMEQSTINQLYDIARCDISTSNIGAPCKIGKCPEGKRSCGKITNDSTRNLI